MKKQAKRIGRNPSSRIRRLTWVGIVVAVLALVATAAVSLRTSQAKDSARQDISQNNAGTRATSLGRNTFAPQTAQIKPLTQQEAQKLAEALKQLVNQSTEGLKSVRHADGSVSMDLEGRFQSMMVARRDEDGKLVQSCVDNPASAAVFFGIDPQLVGVPGSAARTSSIVSEKGGDR